MALTVFVHVLYAIQKPNIDNITCAQIPRDNAKHSKLCYCDYNYIYCMCTVIAHSTKLMYTHFLNLSSFSSGASRGQAEPTDAASSSHTARENIFIIKVTTF